MKIIFTRKKNGIEDKIETVVAKIIEHRENKGYSLEYVAQQLGLSLSAYNKIEKLQTKLTLERLFQIHEILECPIQELLSISGDTVYHQSTNGQSTGFQAGTQHLYQDSKVLAEQFIASLKEENKFLKKLVERSQL